MSSINITTKTLLGWAAITNVVGQRIYPVTVPQNAAMPYIVVRLVSESEEDLLQGASQIREGRVSVESVTAGNIPQLFTLGEAVIDAMRDRVEYAIANCIVTTRKAGTDETDDTSAPSDEGYASAVRRITDFYLVWRKA